MNREFISASKSNIIVKINKSPIPPQETKTHKVTCVYFNFKIYCCRAWPQYVKDRIKATYLYFGGSIAICAGSAVAAFQSPTLMNLMTKNSLLVNLHITRGMFSSPSTPPC